MNCKKCGNQIRGEEKFCTSCGTPVINAEPTTTDNNEKKASLKSKYMIGALAIVAIGIGIAIGLLTKNTKEEKHIAEQNTEVQAEREIVIEDVQEEDKEVADGDANSVTETTPTKGSRTGLLGPDGREIIMCDFQLISSSTLVEAGYNYDVSNLQDLNPNTCWVEGASGMGIGHKVEYVSNQSQSVAGIAILPGFWQSKELFYKNARPSKIRIAFGGTDFVRDVYLEWSEKNPIGHILYIPFPENTAFSYATVAIEDVVSGYKFEDVCISEMFLYTY